MKKAVIFQYFLLLPSGSKLIPMSILTHPPVVTFRIQVDSSEHFDSTEDQDCLLLPYLQDPMIPLSILTGLKTKSVVTSRIQVDSFEHLDATEDRDCCYLQDPMIPLRILTGLKTETVVTFKIQ
jgi:hypothetical protein